MAVQKLRGVPRSKRAGTNNSPSRQRYWSSRRLERRKIRNLIVHCGMMQAEAYIRWHDTRKGRMKKG